MLAVGLAGLRAAPDIAAKLPAPGSARGRPAAGTRRGGALDVDGLLAGRLLGPPIVKDEPAEPDPFDSIFDDPNDEAFLDQPRVVPFVVVGEPAVKDAVPPPVEQVDDLPLEEFDDISLGLLRVKARALPMADLELLLDHERTRRAARSAVAARDPDRPAAAGAVAG